MICISEVYFYNDPALQNTGEEKEQCAMCGSFEYDLVPVDVFNKKKFEYVVSFVCEDCAGELNG